MNYHKLLRVACLLIALVAAFGAPTGGATATATVTARHAPQCGKWNVVPSPNPYSYVNVLNGVAVVSPTNIWAVGQGGNFNDYQTLIEHWDGASWQVIPTPSVQGALYGVTALAANNVWAVGETALGLTLIEHWDGSQWSVAHSPSAKNFVNQLYGVAATSPSDIWAVGYSNKGASSRTLIEHWDGARWSIFPSPDTQTGVNELYGVTAISSTDAWTVGFDGSNVFALAEHWNGSQWQITSTPNASSRLLGVTAIASNDIWAVGIRYTKKGYNMTLTEHWNGSQWSIINSPGKTQSHVLELTGVTASGANNVWAVGNNYSGGGSTYTTPLVDYWNGKYWKAVSSPRAGDEANVPVAVAMSSPHDLWTVGYYYNFVGNEIYSLIEYYC